MPENLKWPLAAVGSASAAAYLAVGWRLARRGQRLSPRVDLAFSVYGLLLLAATVFCFAASD